MTGSLSFLSGGGEAARLIRARDWSGHALGAPEAWPAAFRTALSLVLNAPDRMLLAWGSGLYLFPNDAWLCSVGGTERAWAIGDPLEAVLGEAWAETRPLLEQALGGTLTRIPDERRRLAGGVTEALLSCSRVADAAGAPGGLLITAVACGATPPSALDHERLMQMYAQAPGFIALVRGPDHRFAFANPAYRRLIGHGDPIGRTVAALLPEAVTQGHIALLDQAYRSGVAVTARGVRYAPQMESGGRMEERYLDFVYQPLLGADGQVDGIFIVGNDVTDAFAAFQALRENEARYRQLFDSMDEGFCVIEFIDGPDGPLSDYVHVEANAAYAVHAGIENVVGQKVRTMVPDEAAGWVELYGEVLRTGAPIRFERELVATGRHLELAAFRIEPASRRQVAVLFQDVTARRRAEESLQRLNETLEARVAEALAERKVLAEIVEGTDAFVQVVGLDFRWIAINRASAREFERIYGVTPRVGDNMLDLLRDEPAEQDALRRIWSRALAGETFVEIATFGQADRERCHYEMHFSPLRDSDGHQIGAYRFAYNVTARLQEQERLRQTEEALRQSQKMEAVGQLTGGLAHDFNNLLAGISGALEIVVTRISQGRLKDVEKYVAVAQGATKRAAALTHRLLAYSRRQTLTPRPTNVNALVTGMEELIRRTVGPSIPIAIVGAADLWPILIDPHQLENALLNLCLNARDAMPDGGRITIATENRWLDRQAANQHEVPEGQYLSLCVTDTGTGMTPDVMAKAFDPFFTTKPIGEGTGLGLSMIYGFAKQSGGHVRIQSEVGNGTTVCIYLPRHYGEAQCDEAEPRQQHVSLARNGETVLVVDDEPTVRLLISDLLEDMGYIALEAADSIAGMRILRSSARIDLLISDVGLPGGMNGRQMADAARELRPNLKVLFITGYAENAILNRGQLAPGMQVLTKPFGIDALTLRIRELVDG